MSYMKPKYRKLTPGERRLHDRRILNLISEERFAAVNARLRRFISHVWRVDAARLLPYEGES